MVVETYPREFYRHIKPQASSPGPWSKRRWVDRLLWVPQLLDWAKSLGVELDGDVLAWVEGGFSVGPNGEDEFDAVVGLLGMIAVVMGALDSGEPWDDAEVGSVEGWILGRAQ